MEAALNDREWEEAERYAAALAAYTAPEPLPWSEFFVARARALARCARSRRGAELKVELRALHAQAEHAGLSVAAPALREALARL